MDQASSLKMAKSLLETTDLSDKNTAIADPEVDHETLQQIYSARDDVRRAEKIHTKAEEAKKKAKKQVDEKQAHLNSLIDDSKKPGLFNQPPDAEEDVDPNGWKSLRLEKIDGFPKGIVVALERDHECSTLGKLVDLDIKLVELKGIGATKAKAAETAMDLVWENNPGWCVDPEPADDVIGKVGADDVSLG